MQLTLKPLQRFPLSYGQAYCKIYIEKQRISTIPKIFEKKKNKESGQITIT